MQRFFIILLGINFGRSEHSYYVRAFFVVYLVFSIVQVTKRSHVTQIVTKFLYCKYARNLSVPIGSESHIVVNHGSCDEFFDVRLELLYFEIFNYYH